LARDRTLHVCSACGAQSTKWQGQCPGCGEWNTLVETVVSSHPAAAGGRSAQGTAGSSRLVSSLSTVKPHAEPRFETGSTELDRVLGGGLTRASVVLIGGDPGIGKSTLLLQAMATMSADRRSLYVTGEESMEQVALRARRLGVDASDLGLLAETQLENILATLAAERPDVAVIDSEGMHRIVGRESVDLIKSGGYRIGAGEIETAILGHPGVIEVAVVGLPDADLGQRIVAFVVGEAAAEELISFVAQQLSVHKRPREVRIVDALPRNAMGKVLKKELM
jgi:hypothetical protein